MAVSNIGTTNQAASAYRTAGPETARPARRERSADDRSESSVVTLSTHARDLHRADPEQQSAQEHIDRINALHRSDEMAQEKSQANARVEDRALEAKQKIDAELYKRINTHA